MKEQEREHYIAFNFFIRVIISFSPLWAITVAHNIQRCPYYHITVMIKWRLNGMKVNCCGGGGATVRK